MTIRKYEGNSDAALERAMERVKIDTPTTAKVDYDRLRNSQNTQLWKPKKKRRSRRRRGRKQIAEKALAG